MTVWAGIVAVIGTVGMVVAGLFAARATTRAAAATAEATQAAARATAEPNQRQADLESFREIRQGLERRLERVEERERGLRSLVRAFAGYVAELGTQMRSHGIEPPAPPARVDEYNRTGV
ncbi:hypothetical protein [Streptomyces venezuelae]|uniref:Uncharacterized protein n=1 Tax=Streptomyces venezuelae TaxID=54571 RepID=A0A5P2B5S5_STRVZ|nr:hypothetical protein [Streptomyces venezuelae]QES25794.1 hypothetical protein DEJ47_04425 [Streptomyces venezuelae]